MVTKKMYTMKHKFVTLLLCFCMIIFTIHAREIRNSNSKNNNNNKNILLRKNNVIHNDMMELKALNAEHLRLQEEAKLSLTPCKVCTYIVEKVKENHNKIPHDDKCTACKFVMERVKQGYGEQGTLQDICIEAANHGHKELQPYCEMVLNSFLKWGTRYKDWLEKGCKQEEEDGEEEMMTPCPNEYMCHQLEDLSDKPFCPKPKLDKIK